MTVKENGKKSMNGRLKEKNAESKKNLENSEKCVTYHKMQEKNEKKI